ncbi:MAG: fatty acid desaturase [Deltaproteobacteria bacterium]|nr:fatty acid desaturase [Deltaproteobacteria bacterium]
MSAELELSGSESVERNKTDFKKAVKECAVFQEPDAAVSTRQLLNTFLPFFLLLVAAYLSLDYSLLLSLLLSSLAGGFMLRIFMIQHDCGHGSFFKSRKANEAVGTLCSLFTLIPYHYWRRQHAIHHSSNGNLDHRGHGDVDLYTVREYLGLSKWARLKFRVARNPLLFLLFGPFWLLFGMNRFVFDKKKTSKREQRSVYITNAFALTVFVLLGLLFGFWKVFLVAAPVFLVASAVGIWLFYMQHQFEHTYWQKDQDWDYFEAAIKGSTFYKLPRILDWITASIGYHHIHHLMPSIPNYNLRPCADNNPHFQEETHTITLLSGFRALSLALWDEEQQRLISFREVRKRYLSDSPLTAHRG